jgi:hypothetical protein
MSQIGRWIYSPIERKYVWVKLPASFKADEQGIDQTIQRLAAQGIAFLVVAGMIWFARELARSFENS